MNPYRSASYAGYIFVILGVILLLFGIYNWFQERHLDSVGVKTRGKVIDLVINPPYRQAEVEFITNKGEKVIFVDKLFWNNQFNTYIVGQVVDVIYDPANPYKSAVINNFFQRNIGPFWPAILAFIAIVAGLLWRKSFLKKAKLLDEKAKGTISDDFYNKTMVKSSNKVGIILFIIVIILTLILIIPFWLAGK